MNDTYGRIIETTKELYHEGGLKAISMRKIGARLDLSATAIYRHFKNKEHLLIAVFEEGFKAFTEFLWDSLAGETPLERLRSTGEAYLRFALEEPLYYQVLFMVPMQHLGYKAMPETAKEELHRAFLFLVDRVRECIDQGSFKEGAAETIAVAIWGHSHGLVSLYLNGHFQQCECDEEFTGFFWNSLDHLLLGLTTESFIEPG